MKTHLWIAAFLAGLTFNLRADLPELSLDMDDGTGEPALLMENQLSAPSFALGEETTGSALALQTQTSAPGAYQAVDRGRDFVRYERAVFTTNRARVSVHTNSYVALETSKHYWLLNGWRTSRAEIDIVANGAVARRTPHKVAFAPNINSPISVEVLTPDNKRLKLRPLGIAYYDFHARTNILIAELKESNGLLIGTNQVIYPDAFTDLIADIRYTLRKSGLEQDIILRQRPALPEEYGLNPTTTRLLILTEFINPPADAQPVRQIRRGWIRATVDKAVNFGAMKIGQGTAFNPDTDLQRNQGIPVQKHWTVLEGRTFLIEEISFPRLVPHLRNLRASVSPGADSRALLARHQPSRNLLLPPVRLATASPKSAIQIAAAPLAQQGLVLDFPLNTTQDDVVLQGDTTYEVTGQVILGGVTTIEGGTVVKYADGARLTLGAVRCKTGPYRPAIFTALFDESVGDCIGEGGTGADCALSLGLGGDLSYVNIRYAKEAIYCANHEYSVSHSQILHCGVGFHSENALFTNCNVLLYQVQTNFYGSFFHGRVEHLTADQADVLAADWDYHEDYGCPGVHSSTLTLVNSLTASITSGYASGLPLYAITCDHVRDFPSGDGIFQTVGAGAHYLIDNANRNAGTADIEPALAAVLRTKTTYPPVVYSSAALPGNTTLSPQAQRDSDALDLGFHYDSLDYVFGGASAYGNLTVTPGTAIGWFNGYPPEPSAPSPCGLWLTDSQQMTISGTLAEPCWIARYDTVQEGANANWTANDSVAAIVLSSWFGDPPARLNARFTKWSSCGGNAGYCGNDPNPDRPYAQVGLTDCELYNGIIGSAGKPYPGAYPDGFANCFFSRAQVCFLNSSCILQHCLLRNSSLWLAYSSGEQPGWTVQDTVLDTAAITICDSLGSARTFDHNAYLTGQPRLQPTSPETDKVVDSFHWQTGPLGDYYQLAESALKDQGSVTASTIGLYHYTTQSDQTKECNSQVDIGLHYVAAGVNGNAVDTDSDGTPDHLEDRNGNGVWDQDETPWGLAIAQQPSNQTVYDGETATFAVVAAGVTPLTYQWRFTDTEGVSTDIPGASGSALVLPSVQQSASGRYSVHVWNPAASLVSADATLTVATWNEGATRLVGNVQDRTLKADTTYYVDSEVILLGTTTIEGGTVIKFARQPASPAPPREVRLVIQGQLELKTGAYRPAVLTCADDDSIGTSLSFSDGSPGSHHYATVALDLPATADTFLRGLRIAHADTAIYYHGAIAQETTDHIRDAQILHCGTAVRTEGSPPYARVLDLGNVLISGVTNAVAGGPLKGQAAHLTVDGCHTFALDAAAAGLPLNVVNCVLASVTAWGEGVSLTGSHNGFFHAPVPGWSANSLSSANAPFETLSGVAHYLKPDSVFRNAGGTTIPADLLATLKTKSTQPPVTLPRLMEVNGQLELFPQVPRYVSGSPDLGYYYDALDYTIAAMLVNGGTVTVHPSTAIGFRQEFVPEEWWPWWLTEIGIDILKGSKLISRGAPDRPIVLADVQLVQEAAEWHVSALLLTDRPTDFDPDDPSKAPPVLDLRFCRLFVSSDWFQLLSGDLLTWSPAASISMRDCDFFGGWLWLGKEEDGAYAGASLASVNNLFDRVKINLDPDRLDRSDPELYVDLSLEMRNNLFRGGLLRLVPIPATAGDWELKDNLFDSEEFLQVATWTLNQDYNAYWPLTTFKWGGTARLAPDAANDRLLTSAPTYQPGPLGDYYLAASSVLYDADKRGSRSVADAGLFHYTTRPDQTKDSEQTGNAIIARHYMATAGPTSTQPADTDGDGIPDYAEDSNGNGLVDALETNPDVADGYLDPDGDHLTNLQEYLLGTHPFIADSHGSGINDGDADFDGDGTPNWIEYQLGSDPLNKAPFANPQLVVVVRNIPKTMTLAGWDWENDPLTFGLASQPAHGTLGGTPPNLVYSPTPGFTGWDSFSFKVNDGHGDSVPAAIHLQVKAPDPVPVADPQSVSLAGSAVNLTLTGSSGGGGALTFTIINAPLHGTLAGTAPNLVYTPDVGYQSGDHFTFKVNNGNADSLAATVSIAHNSAPVVNAGSDLMVHLPDTVNLNGSVIDDGVPNPAVSVSWEVLSGPGTVLFGDASAANTTAQFSSLGTYTLRLSASDSQLSASDHVAVEVRADGELIIITQPADQTEEPGTAVTFAVAARGSGNLTYEWHHNGTIVGTDWSLEIDPIEDADLGAYYVIVSDGTSTLTSRTAQLALAGDSVPPPDSLVGWWRAENSGMDQTGLHNGTLSGITFVSGELGNAFCFDSTSDRVVVADDPQFAFTQSLTIEGWIMVDTFTHGFVFVRGNNQSGVAPYYLSVEPGGVLRFYISSGTGSDQLDTSPTQGAWHHVAAVLDDAAGQMLLYIDGQVANQRATAVRPFGHLDPSTQPGIGIGNHPLATQNAPFSGKIDELSVYSTALTTDDIQGIYESPQGKLVIKGPRLPPVQFTASGTRPIPDSVALAVPGFPNATIIYTLNGQIPTRSSGTVCTGPITLAQPTTIIAFAILADCEDGPTTIQKFGYAVDQTRVFGNNQVGVQNSTLPLPFVANITTSSGKPVPDGESVTFTARSPSGADVTANLSNNSDTTGSAGLPGLVQTHLTLGTESGTYSVVAHYGGQDITFKAETITPLAAYAANDRFVPLDPNVPSRPTHLVANASGGSKDTPHTMGASVTGQNASMAMEETAPGSGTYTAPVNLDWLRYFFGAPGSFSYCSADCVADPAKSDYGDSDEFDFLWRTTTLFQDTEWRGSIRSPRYWVKSFGAFRDFLKDGGTKGITIDVNGSPITLYVPAQADIIYISTHGHHTSGTLETPDGLFSPVTDLGNKEWKQGLDIVVIAGCAVLDVTGTKIKPRLGNPLRFPNSAPGRKWAKTGPCTFLGYEGYAPLDKSGGPVNALDTWMEDMEFALDSPSYAWLYANWFYQQIYVSCHNASTIEACFTPRKAYHLVGTLGGSFLNNFQEVPESQWRGHD